MQVIERPQLHKRALARESRTSASLRATTLTVLSQRQSSGYSREVMRESVMSWAALKWPEMLIGRDACGISFEARSPTASVEVTCAVDGQYIWSFRGTRRDIAGRVWETCVLVLGAQDHDVLIVRTGYTGDILASPCAQPQFLHSLVDHLPFEDGGYPVETVPRQVLSVAAFDNLRDHLLSPRRTLPILAVANETQRETDAPRAPSPGVLARTLCGLVHVVSLGALGVACLEDWLGPQMAVHPGEARLFMPGLDADASPDRHPRFTELDASHPAESHVETAAQIATHAWSTSSSRGAEFAAVWARAVGP